jgi:hypothetical protein
MKQPKRKGIDIPDDIAARYTSPNQAQQFDKAVRKVFSISPKQAAAIRQIADLNPTPRGRQPKGTIPASRVPVASPLF